MSAHNVRMALASGRIAGLVAEDNLEDLDENFTSLLRVERPRQG